MVAGETNPLIHTLVAVQAQLTALQAMVEAALAQVLVEQAVIPKDGACDHPEALRVNMDTMGMEAWECRRCGYRYEKRYGGD